MNITEAIERVVSLQSLSEMQSRAVMSQIMEGEATPAQIAALLVALRMKGETNSELVGFAKEMRERVVPVHTSRENIVDTCGTGGDTVKTFNISTAAAIVAAAAGATVAKHGNRAVTSKCGSADVLEALGVNLNLDAAACGKLLDGIGIAFMFAPQFHPSMKHAAGPRREIKLRTVFNLIGPLTNPAGAQRQILGVHSPHLLPKMAQVLRKLGRTRAIVAHGNIGLDEISPIGITQIIVVEGDRIQTRKISPEDFGIDELYPEQISTGDSVEENATRLTTAISDAASPEAHAIIPSAAATLWAAGTAHNFADGADRARDAIKSGSAAKKLQELIEWSNKS